MTTKPISISALSPLIQFAPPPDVDNAVWNADQGGIQNGDLTTGTVARVLQGAGTMKFQGFGTGFDISGGISGQGCTYVARIQPADGNKHTSNLPADQTSPTQNGMLASFSGLEIGMWNLYFQASCSGGGSRLKVSEITVQAWVGEDGSSVNDDIFDDVDPRLGYSAAGWVHNNGLSAKFHDDTQTYTNLEGSYMNITFSGSALLVWGSVDDSHGPYSASLSLVSDPSQQITLNLTSRIPFLAVPIPIYYISGLNPRETYYFILENTSSTGNYTDVDYVEVYSASGGPPPGGSGAVLQAPKRKLNLPAIIGGAVGGVVLLIALIAIFVLVRKRKKLRVTGGGNPDILNGMQSGLSIGAPLSAQTSTLITTPWQPNIQNTYQPVGTSSPGTSPMFGPHGSTTPTSSGTGGYPFPPRPALYDPVTARRESKANEIEAARLRATNPSILTPSSPSTVPWDTASHMQSPSTIDPSVIAPDEPPPTYTKS